MLDPKIEQTTHVNNTYNDFSTMNFGPKVRKTAQNYEDYKVFNGGGVQFRPNETEDESGVCSPPLWRTSPPHSPVHARQNNNYQYLSPSSRAQAIARGQVELMEMVKNMPESSYELSLKDLVEHNYRVEEEECLVDEKISGYQRVKSKGKEKEKKVRMIRSGSIDHNKGVFIHMVFPLSFGSKKKKHLATNPFARVSPKPDGDKLVKGTENNDWWKKKMSFSSETESGVNDWWKKRFSVSSESESGITSSNCGSSVSESESGITSSNCGSSGSSGSSSTGSRNNNIRQKNGCLPGCSPNFLSRKKTSKK